MYTSLISWKSDIEKIHVCGLYGRGNSFDQLEDTKTHFEIIV